MHYILLGTLVLSKLPSKVCQQACTSFSISKSFTVNISEKIADNVLTLCPRKVLKVESNQRKLSFIIRQLLINTKFNHCETENYCDKDGHAPVNETSSILHLVL